MSDDDDLTPTERELLERLVDLEEGQEERAAKLRHRLFIGALLVLLVGGLSFIFVVGGNEIDEECRAFENSTNARYAYEGRDPVDFGCD